MSQMSQMKPSAIKHNFGAKSMILEDFWTKTMPENSLMRLMKCCFGDFGMNYDVILENDERLEHEDITLADMEAFVLQSVKAVRLQDFRWLISSEDASPMPGQPTITRHIAAHSSHANVLGVYLERKLPLGRTGYPDTISNLGSGGDEAMAWDTNDESYWIPTHETNDRLGITRVVSGTVDGKVRVESLEWENNNMLWEDMSKQLIIEPQAFIVGSITNDTSMTVTRKHLGGIEDAEYRL